MRKIVFMGLIGLLFFGMGCNDNNPKPKNLVSENKMAEILTEIYLHQQPTYMNEIPNREWNMAETDLVLIEKHGLSLDDFRASYRYYVMNPDRYNKILRLIRDELENKLPEDEKNRRILDRKRSEKGEKN